MPAYCSCCGAEITLKAQACPACGAPQHGMIPADRPPLSRRPDECSPRDPEETKGGAGSR